MLRLGLCCIFHAEPIKFRTTTAAYLARIGREAARAKLGELCRANAVSLLAALQFCAAEGIGSFRIMSQILPLKTHPDWRYELTDLPGGEQTLDLFRACGEFAAGANLRTTFHPDQFIVLSSPRAEVVTASLQEIEYQAQVSAWIGADVINVHLGGAYGDKPAALARFAESLKRLSPAARARLTVENDDKTYRPQELLPLCQTTGVPLVYDVHHHRCLPDELSVEEATAAALGTWNREPLFHLSSPLAGWDGPQPARHHDFIDPADFPASWLPLNVTIEVEAKAKEVAIRQLRSDLKARYDVAFAP